MGVQKSVTSTLALVKNGVGLTLTFLRRIPKDPMTNSFEWGLRSTRDDPDSTGWGGQNVFDVYTKSTDKAPDGTAYAEW